MSLTLYQPRVRARGTEMLSISKNRLFILNKAATARVKTHKYVHLYYNQRGTVLLDGVKEASPTTLKIHFSRGNNVCWVAAGGLLRTLHYRASAPTRRFPLKWDETTRRLQLEIPRELLTGRHRRRRRSTAAAHIT